MSKQYNQTQWADGDLITSEKMNNIENQLKFVSDLFNFEMIITPPSV